eukprot:TRINITY_DN13447_c0_g1_i1.p1 TRINITY_DN13447_c0_g1~~TRINITY_DN13447_c0_g1_i1.p1  ORF type:complete len:235 (-),score=33.40 TRINITY_DN13447_c0_g1_i1:455-1159(-)
MASKRQLPLQLQKLPDEHLRKVRDQIQGLLAVGLQEITDLNALDALLAAVLKSDGNGASAAFPTNQMVEIHGLTGAPEHNGKLGRILRLDEASGRYVVELECDGTQKSFKPANLKAAEGAPKAKAKSSEKVEAARKDREKEKAAMKKENATEPPKAGDFTVGERVRVGGLNGNVELNGQLAVVFGMDKASGRYIVEFENGQGQKRLHGKNLTPQGIATGALAAKARMFAQMGQA